MATPAGAEPAAWLSAIDRVHQAVSGPHRLQHSQRKIEPRSYLLHHQEPFPAGAWLIRDGNPPASLLERNKKPFPPYVAGANLSYTDGRGLSLQWCRLALLPILNAAHAH